MTTDLGRCTFAVREFLFDADSDIDGLIAVTFLVKQRRPTQLVLVLHNL